MQGSSKKAQIYMANLCGLFCLGTEVPGLSAEIVGRTYIVYSSRKHPNLVQIKGVAA